MIIIFYALVVPIDSAAAAASSKQTERFPWEGTVSASTLTCALFRALPPAAAATGDY
jgi:hypothetical protein